jgi:DNA (cytosine-5)-methyltransferase 1
MNLVSTEPVIMDTQFGNTGQSIDDPLGTITANRKWHYLLNPQHGGHTQGIDRPCPTIIARQDKAPLYLMDVVGGSLVINVLDTDSDTVKNIKAFMAMYGIIDIRMRMLKVSELKKIQGFPDSYELLGNQADQKKFIGNSVCPAVVKAWVLALAEAVTSDTIAA